jgi:hypothetical protein
MSIRQRPARAEKPRLNLSQSCYTAQGTWGLGLLPLQIARLDMVMGRVAIAPAFLSERSATSIGGEEL